MSKNRYEFIQRLGAGGQGTVSLVRDVITGQQLALKTINATSLEKSWFVREFEMLADITHPRLVQVHDFGADSEGIYFTRDHIPGSDLFDATQDANILELVALSVDICRSIGLLHQVGIVHGDIKPGNLIVDEAGVSRKADGIYDCRVWPIDFSFAAPPSRAAQLVGTVHYMAPELLTDKVFNQQTDIYALGMTLYEICAGKCPFEGDVDAVIQAHLAPCRPPVDMARVAVNSQEEARIAAGYAAIVARLISHNPGERFYDLDEVEAAFTNLCPQHIGRCEDSTLPVTNLLKNRDETAKTLASRMIADNSAPLYVIRGDAGCGKSRLSRYTKWQLQLQGVQVVELALNRFGDAGTLVQQVCRQLMCLLDVDNDASLRDSCQQVMTQVPVDVTGYGRTFERIWCVIRHITRQMPCVFVFFDVTDRDKAALHFIRALLNGGDDMAPVPVMLTCDNEFDWPASVGDGEEISLRPFTRSQMDKVVAQYSHRFTEPQLNYIYQRTGGNPLFVSELLAVAVKKETDVKKLSSFIGPAAVKTHVALMLSKLDEATMAVLWALAVLQRSAHPEDIARLTGGAVDSSVLAALQRRGVLRFDERGYLLHSSLWRHELMETMRSDVYHKYSARAFAHENDAVLKLHHAVVCNDEVFVRENGMDLVRRLEARGDIDRAATAAQILVDANMAGISMTAALMLGKLSVVAQNTDLARRCFENVCQSDEPNLQANGWLNLGHLAMLSGQFDVANTHFEKASSLSSDRNVQAEILDNFAELAFRKSEYQKAVEFIDVGLADSAVTDEGRAQLNCTRAKALSAQGQHDAAQRSARDAVTLAMQSGDQQRKAACLDVQSWVFAQSGELDKSTSILEEAAGLYREMGAPMRLARALRVLASNYWWLARLDLMVEKSEAAFALLSSLENPVDRNETMIAHAYTLLCVGRYEKSMLILLRTLKEADRIGNVLQRGKSLVYQGHVYAGEGKWPGALECWHDGLRIFKAHRNWSVCAELLLEMAQVYIAIGDDKSYARADTCLQEARQIEREDLGRDFELFFDLVYGQWLLAKGEWQTGMQHMEQLERRLEKVEARYLAWQFQLEMGEAFFNTNAMVLARARVETACSIIDDLCAGFSPENRQTFWQNVKMKKARQLRDKMSSVVLVAKDVSSPAATDASETSVHEREALYRVLEFIKQISLRAEVDSILTDLLDMAIDLMRANSGFLLTPGSNGLVVSKARNTHREDVSQAHQLFSKSIGESVHLDRKPIITVDAAVDERFNQFLSIHALELRSVICVPIQYRDASLGVLYLENHLQKNAFTQQHLRMLQALADQVAISISHHRALQTARAANAQLKQMEMELQAKLTHREADLKKSVTGLELARKQLARMDNEISHRGDYRGLIGQSSVMQQIFRTIERIKDIELPVVLEGESGTGKDAVARAIHSSSQRASGPFVVLPCGSIPDTLLESSLFGHDKGAFSGAESDKPGLFQTANGGTLYIDDISDMSSRMQVAFLRVLEESVYSPLGSQRTIKADFRIICSSRQPLALLVKQKILREDLFFRLQVLTLKLKPLSERIDDIPALVRHFVERESATLGIGQPTVTLDALSKLKTYHFDGNVRELAQLIKRALIVQNEAGKLTSADLLPADASIAAAAGPVRRDERQEIIDALENSQWNKTRAAKLLGMPRRTFYRRLDKYGLNDAN